MVLIFQTQLGTLLVSNSGQFVVFLFLEASAKLKSLQQPQFL